MKMRKIIPAVLSTVLCGVLLSQVWYLPHYLRAAVPVEAGETGSEICVMSANVRCYSPTDLGKKSWFYRADLLLQNIAAQSPDIIGFQEVTPLHYKYLTEHLHGYDHVIAYRDNAPMHEGCPVFYNTAKFTLRDKGSFWLSETPETSSKDWGAAFARVCSYVILTQKETGKDLVVFNTHLDHVSDEARIRGIGVVLDKLRQFGGLPCVLMGDMNAEEDSETYRAATADFDDAKYRTENPPKGPTYQNFGEELDAENIDYFLVSKTGVRVTDYRIVDTTFDGVYPSDHFPIVMHMDMM